MLGEPGKSAPNTQGERSHLRSLGDLPGEMGMQRFMTLRADVLRSPPVTDGRRGVPEQHLTNIPCTPLDPVEPDLRERLGLRTPHELLQTFMGDVDVREGDILVVNGQEYPIRSCAEWEWRGETFRHLIVEDLKE